MQEMIANMQKQMAKQKGAALDEKLWIRKDMSRISVKLVEFLPLSAG